MNSLPIFRQGDGFNPPTLDHEFFPPALFFEGTIFELNRITLIRMLAAVVIALIFVWYARNRQLVPNRRQAAIESLMEFSKVQITEEIIGKEQAAKYQPMIMTIFIGVFFMNMTAVIPGLQIAGTSLVGMPLIYALFAFVGFIVAGIKQRGGLRFFKEQLFPSGVPWPVYFILTPIEFISTFILRPVTLTVRLLMNMVAGHLVIVMIFLGTHYLYFTVSGVVGATFGTLTFVGSIAYLCFEIFVAALQAYIFAMLSAVYISLSISKH